MIILAGLTKERLRRELRLNFTESKKFYIIYVKHAFV